MGRLILIRHGKTVLNSFDDAERLRGWMDVPLDPQGIEEAEEIARRLAMHPIERIYCSDLHRARQTARQLLRLTTAPIVYTSALRPWNVGILAGQRVLDVLPLLKRLEADPARSAPGGESFLDFYNRYERKLWDLLHMAAGARWDIVAFTHVRNLLVAPTIVHGGDKTRIRVKGGPKTGSLMWIEREHEQWRVRVDKPIETAVEGAFEVEIRPERL